MAQYLYNCPEYLESMFAVFKAGLVPVNTNYRYADDELVYLWDNADAVAVVFHGSFAERIERVRDRVPEGQDLAVGRRRQRPVPRVGRSRTRRRRRPRPSATRARHGSRRRRPPLLYTGGTTGMPKGVMWRQDDLVVHARTRRAAVDYGADADLDKVARDVRRSRAG